MAYHDTTLALYHLADFQSQFTHPTLSPHLSPQHTKKHMATAGWLTPACNLPIPSQADICQLGMDQRKVNMLAREYCDDIKRKLKPVILSHR